jgi:hypothetical protein
MRVAFGKVPLLDRHLARLASGGAGPPVLARVRAAVAEQLERFDTCAPYGRLGITVTPDGAVAAGISSQHSSLDVADGPLIVPIQVSEPLALRLTPPSRRAGCSGTASIARRRFKAASKRCWSTPRGLIDGSTANVWLLRATRSRPPAPPAVTGVARSGVRPGAIARAMRSRSRLRLRITTAPMRCF